MGRNALWNLTNIILYPSNNVTLAENDGFDLNFTITILTIWITAVLLLIWALLLGSRHCSQVNRKKTTEDHPVKEVPPAYEYPPAYNVALQMNQGSSRIFQDQ